MSTYPAATASGLHIRYDADGSSCVYYAGAGGGINTPSAAQITSINSDGGGNQRLDTGFEQNNFFAVIFSLLWDIKAAFAVYTAEGGGATPAFGWSPDTTDGRNNTWHALAEAVPTYAAVAPWYRSNIIDLSADSIASAKGFRLNINGTGGAYAVNISALHIYGVPSASQNGTTDVLVPWHPTFNQVATGAVLDYGDQARGVAATVALRWANWSGTHSARSVTVGREILTNSSPDLLAQTQLSLSAGGPWTNTVSLGDIAPGALSAVVYQQLSLTGGAAVGPWRPSIAPTVSSWS